MKASGKILLGLLAAFLIVQLAFAASLEEGKSVKVTGANAYAGKELFLRFNGAIQDNAQLYAGMELLDSENNSIMAVRKVPVGLNVRAYFIDRSTGLASFSEKITISSVSYPQTAAGYSKRALMQFELAKQDLNKDYFEIPLDTNETVSIPSLGISVTLGRVEMEKRDQNAPALGGRELPKACVVVSGLKQGSDRKSFFVSSGNPIGVFGNTIDAVMVYPTDESKGMGFFTISSGASAESPALPGSQFPIPGADQAPMPAAKQGTKQDNALPEVFPDLQIISFVTAVLSAIAVLVLAGLIVLQKRKKAHQVHAHKHKTHEAKDKEAGAAKARRRAFRRPRAKKPGAP